jgi:Lrp/AsnC family transcriptional regulator, leucine-responsive regulatory protein
MDSKGLLADRRNIELLRFLQKKPRASITELARHVGMSGPAVKERILRIEESGILESYRVELNPKKLGYDVMAFVRVRPLAGHSSKVVEVARSMPQVTECHRVTGEDCFVLKLHVKEIEQLDRVLDKLLAHGQTTTSIVQSTPIPLRNLPVSETE